MMVTFGLSSMNSGAVSMRPIALDDPRPVAVEQPTVAQLGDIETRLCGEHALGDLEVAHLEGEEEHRHPVVRGGVRRQSQREGRLAHRRPGADHDQVGGLEPRQQVVELAVTGRHTGYRLAPPVEMVETFEALGQELLEGAHRVGGAALRDVEDERLGLVERSGDVGGDLVADLGDLVGDPDQPAKQRVLLDDARVAPGARDRRCVRLQRDEGRGTARRVQHADSAQLLGNRHKVGRFAPCIKRGDGREDVGVRRLVEVLGTHLLDHDRDRVPRKQHRPQH